jgi:predicted nucleic acid-binding Zn ribbon protein
MAHGKVELAWKAAVGPAVDRVTRVKLEGQVLIVDAQTPHWVQEVRRSSSLILRRLQGLLGEDVVREIHVRA